MFCFTSNDNSHFLRKKRDPAKRVVDFPRERDTLRIKNHGNRTGFRRKKLQQQRQTLEIVEDLACEAKFLHFPFIFHMFSFFRFFLQFFHCFMFFHFSLSSFFNFSCSFIFFIFSFLSFSSFFHFSFFVFFFFFHLFSLRFFHCFSFFIVFHFFDFFNFDFFHCF